MANTLLSLGYYYNESKYSAYMETDPPKITYEVYNQPIMAEMKTLFANSTYMIFNVSPTFMNYFRKNLNNNKYFFPFALMRIYFYFNKHVIVNKQNMRQILNSIDRILTEDKKHDASDNLQFLALKMKIEGPHMDINRYSTLVRENAEHPSILYSVGRLALKYCNYNQAFMELCDSALDTVIKMSQIHRDERQLSMCFYQKVYLFRIQNLHKRPLLIIQGVCAVFQSYGFPFAHKIYEL